MIEFGHLNWLEIRLVRYGILRLEHTQFKYFSVVQIFTKALPHSSENGFRLDKFGQCEAVILENMRPHIWHRIGSQSYIHGIMNDAYTQLMPLM